jgi:DNA polymerase III alpha subunit
LFTHFRGQYRCVMSPTIDSSVMRMFVQGLKPEDLGSLVVTSLAAYKDKGDAPIAMQRASVHSENDSIAKNESSATKTPLPNSSIRDKYSPLYYPERQQVASWAKLDNMVSWALDRGVCVDSDVYINAESVIELKSEPEIHALDEQDDFNKMIQSKWNMFVKDGALSPEDLEIYKTRLREEVDVINSVDGFGSYFTNTARMIDLFEEDLIEVSLRGSGAGSLVVYLMGACKVDPVEHGLSFERFLSTERSDPPDLDLDVAKQARCYELMREHHGEMSTANLTTFSGTNKWNRLFELSYNSFVNFDERCHGGSKTFIDAAYKRVVDAFKSLRGYDASRTFEEQVEIPRIKQVIKSDGADMLYEIALKLKSLNIGREVSKGSVILNPKGVTSSYSATQPKHEGELWCTELTRESVGLVGEIKYDVLSSKALEKISKIKEMEDLPFGSKIDIHDPEIYKLINSGALSFLFHINTFGGKQTISDVKPESFKELMACIAVMRCSDRSDPELEYQKYITGKKNGPTYKTPLLSSVLDDTYGSLIYEEQLLKLCTDVAGIDYTSADRLRSAIKKKKKDVIEELKPKFISSLIANHGGNVSEDEARDVYAEIESKFGTYLMGKSHCAAYCYVICEQAFLKAKYPLSYSPVHLDAVPNKSRDEAKNTLHREYTQMLGYRFSRLDVLTCGVKGRDEVVDNIRVITPGLESILPNPMVVDSVISARSVAHHGLVVFAKSFCESMVGKRLPILDSEQHLRTMADASSVLSNLGAKGALDSFVPSDIRTSQKKEQYREDLRVGMPMLVKELFSTGDHAVSLKIKEDLPQNNIKRR